MGKDCKSKVGWFSNPGKVSSKLVVCPSVPCSVRWLRIGWNPMIVGNKEAIYVNSRGIHRRYNSEGICCLSNHYVLFNPIFSESQLILSARTDVPKQARLDGFLGP